jgi:hypothetical protein
MNPLLAALLITACAGGLAGCGPSGERPLHERTLMQDESSRMRY